MHSQPGVKLTLKDVALGVLQYLKGDTDMHVLIDTGVVVDERPLVLRLDQEIVVDPVVPHIMDAAGNDDAHQFQIRQVLSHVVECKHCER